MNFHILTLFPEMIAQGLSTSITGRAIQQNKISVHAVDIRDYAKNRHRKVDDYTYGGGAGMLMQAQPVYDAWTDVCSKITESCSMAYAQEEDVTLCSSNHCEECFMTEREASVKEKHPRTIYVTPQGRLFNQKMAEEFSKEDDLIILCGHYEGIDERVLEEIVTDEVSIGDYVLTGGELAAMVITDAVARLVPGVLHNEDSAVTETFHGNLLEYPQYSRPEEWHGRRVPQVLLSGNERKIREWRLEQSAERTRIRRPDLYEKYDRLQQCRTFLMRQKILHIDMIEAINRNRAELLYWQDGEILLREKATGVCFHTNLNISSGICIFKSDELTQAETTDSQAPKEQSPKEQSLQKQTLQKQTLQKAVDSVWFLKKLDPDILSEIHSIVAHQEVCAHELETHFNRRITCICYQAVCTRREMLPVTGLYRTDGAPLENGINQGMQIRRVPTEYASLVSQAYHLEHEESYIYERIASGAIYGAFFGDELAGFIGFHSEGSIGMLEVLPEYRGRHIGKALETYMGNYSIARGMIPYGQVIIDNEVSLNMQQNMGQFISKTPVFWMEKK